ncbi:MAG: hypothetical protein WCB53_03295 [Terriglobales bacterium]
MKRTRFPGLIDVARVSDPAEIRDLLRDNQVDRRFDASWPLLNGLLLRRLIRVLSFQKKRFPTFRPRDDRDRSSRQDALWTKLNDRAAALTTANSDVQSLARWVQGLGKEEEVGVLIQQAVGRLFVESYSADSESWAAARILAGALQAKGIATFFPNNIAKVRNAKKLLAVKVDGDLAGVHATGVALHNLVRGLQRMRLLYGDITQRSKLTPEAASKECLFAPALVLRQATGSGKQTGCPYDKNTVFLFDWNQLTRRLARRIWSFWTRLGAAVQPKHGFQHSCGRFGHSPLM